MKHCFHGQTPLPGADNTVPPAAAAAAVTRSCTCCTQTWEQHTIPICTTTALLVLLPLALLPLTIQLPPLLIQQPLPEAAPPSVELTSAWKAGSNPPETACTTIRTQLPLPLPTTHSTPTAAAAAVHSRGTQCRSDICCTASQGATPHQYLHCTHCCHHRRRRHRCCCCCRQPIHPLQLLLQPLPEGAPPDIALAQVFMADGLRDQPLHLRRHAVACRVSAAAVAAAAAIHDVVPAHELVCHSLHDSHGTLIQHLTRITSCVCWGGGGTAQHSTRQR